MVLLIMLTGESVGEILHSDYSNNILFSMLGKAVVAFQPMNEITTSER